MHMYMSIYTFADMCVHAYMYTYEHVAYAGRNRGKEVENKLVDMEVGGRRELYVSAL